MKLTQDQGWDLSWLVRLGALAAMAGCPGRKLLIL